MILCLALLLLGQVTASQAAAPSSRDVITKKGTASVKGRVVAADTGRPVRRVEISISSADLSESRSMSTTAQGLFEFTELPAARYTITASRAGFLRLQYGQRRPGEPGRPLELADGQHVADVNFALPRTGSIAGRITDELGEPLANVTIFPASWRYFRGKRRLVRAPGGVGFNRTDDTGQYRITGLDPGEYFVMATTRDTWTSETNPKERVGFLTTYSGGVANPADAQRVKVAMGQEVFAPDFAMVPGRVASVSGTALSSSGAPLAGESIDLVQEFASPSGSTTFGMPNTKVNPDGSWTFPALPPGEYRLTVRIPADKEHAAEGATTTIAVGGDDLTGIALITGAAGVINGRVVTDTGGPLPPSEQRMRVLARAIDPTRNFGAFSQDNGRVRDDGTFELKDVIGENRLSIGPLPREWAIKSIDYEGRDLMDTPIDVAGGQRLEGVTIVLSKSLPRLRGTLMTEAGGAADGSVLIFPEDPQKWSEDSRLIRTARPDTAGAFEFRNVIPGTYLAVPLDYVRDGEWADPEFLENLKEHATRVTVEPTGTSGLALTLKRSQG